MYTVYVIKNKDNKLYKGFTDNLERRLYQHNNGLTRWTKNRGPWSLVYKEEYEDKKQALSRKKFLKSGKGRSFLKSIIY